MTSCSRYGCAVLIWLAHLVYEMAAQPSSQPVSLGHPLVDISGHLLLQHFEYLPDVQLRSRRPIIYHDAHAVGTAGGSELIPWAAWYDRVRALPGSSNPSNDRPPEVYAVSIHLPGFGPIGRIELTWSSVQPDRLRSNLDVSRGTYGIWSLWLTRRQRRLFRLAFYFAIYRSTNLLQPIEPAQSLHTLRAIGSRTSTFHSELVAPQYGGYSIFWDRSGNVYRVEEIENVYYNEPLRLFGQLLRASRPFDTPHISIQWVMIAQEANQPALPLYPPRLAMGREHSRNPVGPYQRPQRRPPRRGNHSAQ